MENDNSAQFDPQRFAGIVRKRRYPALFAGLAVVSLFTWGSLLWPRTYEASSTVFIEKSTIIPPLMQGTGVSGNIEERLNHLRNRMTNSNILERVVQKIDLPEKGNSPGHRAKLVGEIQNKLDVKVKGGRERETDLFTISFTGRDPKIVRDVVNTLVSEYIELSLASQRDDAYGAYEFIDSQLKESKKQLEDSDRLIRIFRENHPHMVPQTENSVLARIESFQTGKIEAEIRLKELARKRENIRKQLSGEKELTVALVTREGTPESRLNYLSGQLVVLMTKYTEHYPEVIKVKSEIEELKKQVAQASGAIRAQGGAETAALNPLYQQLKEDLARTDTEIEALQARLTELERQQKVAFSSLRTMPKEQEEWAKLQRDRTAMQRTYDDLLQKLERARISKNLEITDKGVIFRIVDPAVLPRLPTKPNRVRLILLGMALGVGSGIGLAVGLDFLDHSFKDENSLAEGLKVPVLSAIPRIVTGEDTSRESRRFRLTALAASAYLVVIGGVLAREFLYQYMGIEIMKFH